MINIVTEKKPYWILGRWAEEFHKRIPNSVISEKANDKADVNIYINYALYDHKTKLDIGIFTHLEKDKECKAYKKWFQASKEMDWCFSQSQLYLKDLPKRKSSQIVIGVGQQFYKRKLSIGVVGREYDSGRKNYEWYDLLEYIFERCIVFKKANGNYTYKQMPKFYREIDYLLVIANNEGGPVPVKEALAMGKPVIAPKGVGWCDEFPCLRYRGKQELIDLLSSLIHIPDLEWGVGTKQLIDKINELEVRSK